MSAGFHKYIFPVLIFVVFLAGGLPGQESNNLPENEKAEDATSGSVGNVDGDSELNVTQETETPEPVVSMDDFSILSAGDTHFVWGVNDLQKKENPDIPFDDVRELFQKADLSILNLETALTTKGEPLANKSYIFNGDVKNLGVLNDLGLDVAVLGNNHAMDMGQEGILDTIKNLNDAGIKTTGGGKNLHDALEPAVFEVDGLSVSVLSFSNIGKLETFAMSNRAGIAHGRYAVNAVRSARKKTDLVIVEIHWGDEYETMPDREQIGLARRLILSGADAVIGHHPHIPQSVESYRGGVIIYSLGNFVFGSVTRLQTDNMIAILNFDREKKRLRDVVLQGVTGVYGETGHIVKRLSPVEARKLWARLYVQTQDLSPATSSRFEILESGQLRIPIN